MSAAKIKIAFSITALWRKFEWPRRSTTGLGSSSAKKVEELKETQTLLHGERGPVPAGCSVFRFGMTTGRG
jgi:hypothetical protein